MWDRKLSPEDHNKGNVDCRDSKQEVAYGLRFREQAGCGRIVQSVV